MQNKDNTYMPSNIKDHTNKTELTTTTTWRHHQQNQRFNYELQKRYGDATQHLLQTLTAHNQRRPHTDHSQHRTTLFTPTDGPGHPPINTLEPDRTTVTNKNFGEVSQRKDDWTVVGNAALPSQWKGTTRFNIKKDYEYIHENHDEEQQQEHHEAHRARGLRQPQQPTPQKIAEQNLTHLPYKKWCPICV